MRFSTGKWIYNTYKDYATSFEPQTWPLNPKPHTRFGGFALDASSGEAALEPKLRAGLAVRLGAAAPDPVGSREPRDLPV